jgi:hypothetical protein
MVKMRWLLMVAAMGGAAWAAQVDNFFVNPSFELRASEENDWKLDKGGATEASFVVNSQEAGDGDRSACVTIGRVAEWGTQFGQAVDAGQQGHTYTFAVLVKAVGQPVTVRLQIERRAKPFDRAAASEPVELKPEGWKCTSPSSARKIFARAGSPTSVARSPTAPTAPICSGCRKATMCPIASWRKKRMRSVAFTSSTSASA